MKKRRFYTWLMSFHGHDNVYGDVATAVSVDKATRSLPDIRDEWQRHIAPTGYTPACDILNELFDKFEAGEEAVERGKAKRSPGVDDVWTISTPIVPNYGQLRDRSLCRIFPYSSDVVADYKHQIEKRNASRGLSYTSVHGEVYGLAVEQLGRYFRREFHYDFEPYAWSNHEKYKTEKDYDIDAYLFLDDTHSIKARAIGACSLILPPEKTRWIMSFVYFHPMARRQGHLSRSWDLFQSIYGDFWTSQPISNSLKSFLQKRGELDLHAGDYSLTATPSR